MSTDDQEVPMEIDEPEKQGVLTKLPLVAMLKALLVAVMIVAILKLYCKMRMILQLLHTMLVGWAIMLDVMIDSDVLQGPEQLTGLIQWILMYTGQQ